MTPRIWGLSKSAAHYRPAPTPEVRCDRCKFMFPRLALGGCRLVRGPIRNSALATNSLLAASARADPRLIHGRGNNY